MSMAEDLYLYCYSLTDEYGGGSISVSGKNKGARTVSGTDHVDWQENQRRLFEVSFKIFNWSYFSKPNCEVSC